MNNRQVTAPQLSPKHVSIVVPFYNEEQNLSRLHSEINKALAHTPHSHDIIFVNDGSTDASVAHIEALQERHPEVCYIEFSRNFGKEVATTAGLHAARGDAVICLDADLQHPPHLIPEFIKRWEEGAEVVIGVREKSKSDTLVKRVGSYCYYKIMNVISETEIIPRATDFRLLDRVVVDEFNRLTERNRLTRGLIEWLGFRRDVIHFEANERENGEAVYNPFKLAKLATASFISHSLLPLRLAGYLGVAIVIVSGVLGIVMVADRFLALGFNFTGPAILAVFILFLVGIVLVSVGLLAFYIAHIHQETQGRPLYVVRKRKLND